MQTDCTPDQFEFEGFGKRRAVAAFDGGNITSDAGALLLREADIVISMNEQVAACFTDGRDQSSVVHKIETLIAQRIGLKGTKLAKAMPATIRLKLFRIGALVTKSVRRIKLALASNCPNRELFKIAHERLRKAAA